MSSLKVQFEISYENILISLDCVLQKNKPCTLQDLPKLPFQNSPAYAKLYKEHICSILPVSRDRIKDVLYRHLYYQKSTSQSI